jgi:regulator of replication initiation timing
MFKKLKDLCTFKKEKKMSPTSTETRTTKQLKEKVSQQSQELSKLRSRVSQLVDEINSLKYEIETFRDRITSDMKVVFESLQKQ